MHTDTPRRPHEARTLLGECQGAPLGQVRVTPTLVAVVGRARPRPPHLVIRATVHVPVLRTADAAHAARLCRGRNEQQSQPTGQGASTDFCGRAHCHSAEVSNLSIPASRLTLQCPRTECVDAVCHVWAGAGGVVDAPTVQAHVELLLQRIHPGGHRAHAT
jgi:hypothetical protein